MKYVKMLGLAAVAAMALMAFLGAGSASATVLCKTPGQTNECAAGWSYGANTTIDASLEPLEGTQASAILESGTTVLDTCTGSTVHGITANAGSSSETVHGAISDETNKKGETIVTGLTWSGCTKTTASLKPGELEIHWISGTDNGTLTVIGTEVTVNTIFGSCTYGPEAGKGLDIGELIGGEEATIKIDATVPRLSGLCPSTATWTAAYKVTTPKPLYVTTK